ncbi:hypothetical protein QQP08_002639 [Theobroma cacao]|nr:hypothetical protein QQP08_002639 [Theobroma cacao]
MAQNKLPNPTGQTVQQAATRSVIRFGVPFPLLSFFQPTEEQSSFTFSTHPHSAIPIADRLSLFQASAVRFSPSPFCLSFSPQSRLSSQVLLPQPIPIRPSHRRSTVKLQQFGSVLPPSTILPFFQPTKQLTFAFSSHPTIPSPISFQASAIQAAPAASVTRPSSNMAQ